MRIAEIGSVMECAVGPGYPWLRPLDMLLLSPFTACSLSMFPCTSLLVFLCSQSKLVILIDHWISDRFVASYWSFGQVGKFLFIHAISLLIATQNNRLYCLQPLILGLC